jgi:ATP synthase subunit 6
MIPYTFTITSLILVTFALGTAMFIGITIRSVTVYKLRFFSLFFPSGAPLALAPLLVMIEFISYLSRGLSISIRLFANMMAGHALCKIIALFVYQMFHLSSYVTIFSFVPLAFLIFIVVLEIGIAFLQAYVFSVLTCIYLNDAHHLH